MRSFCGAERLGTTKRPVPVRHRAFCLYGEMKMMKVDDCFQFFLASPSGKMILLTKKKMIIEMPPLSTVVPML